MIDLLNSYQKFILRVKEDHTTAAIKALKLLEEKLSIERKSVDTVLRPSVSTAHLSDSDAPELSRAPILDGTPTSDNSPASGEHKTPSLSPLSALSSSGELISPTQLEEIKREGCELKQKNETLELTLATQLCKIKEQATKLEQQKELLFLLYADQSELEKKLLEQESKYKLLVTAEEKIAFQADATAQQFKVADLEQRLAAIQLELKSAQQRNLTTSTAHSKTISSLEEKLHEQTNSATATIQSQSDQLVGLNEVREQLIESNKKLQALLNEKLLLVTAVDERNNKLTAELEQVRMARDKLEEEARELNEAASKARPTADTEAKSATQLIASDPEENARLYAELQQLKQANLQLQQQQEKNAVAVPQSQITQPAKKAWWKYALAAVGIVLGAFAIVTGVGALLGVSLLAVSLGSTVAIGATAGGGVLLAGSTAYTVIAARGDKRAQAEYEVAIRAARHNAGPAVEQLSGIILPSPSPKLHSQLQGDLNTGPKDRATQFPSAARSMHSFHRQTLAEAGVRAELEKQSPASIIRSSS